MAKDVLKIEESKKLSPLEYRRRLFEAKVLKFNNEWELYRDNNDPEFKEYKARVIYNNYKFFFREVRTLFPNGPGDDKSLAAEIYRLSSRQPQAYIKLKKEKKASLYKSTVKKRKDRQGSFIYMMSRKRKRKSQHIAKSQKAKQENPTLTSNMVIETKRGNILGRWIQDNKQLFQNTSRKVATFEDIEISKESLQQKHRIREFETEFVTYHRESDDWIKYRNFERYLEREDYKRLEELQTPERLEKLEKFERLEELEEIEEKKKRKAKRIERKREALTEELEKLSNCEEVKTFEILEKLEGFEEVNSLLKNFEGFQEFEEFEELLKYVKPESFRKIKEFLKKIQKFGDFNEFEESEEFDKLEEIRRIKEHKRDEKEVKKKLEKLKRKEDEFHKTEKQKSNVALREELKTLRKEFYKTGQTTLKKKKKPEEHKEILELLDLLTYVEKDLEMQRYYGRKIWNFYKRMLVKSEKLLSKNENKTNKGFTEKIYTLYKGKFKKYLDLINNPEEDIEEEKKLEAQCWDEIVSYAEECDLENALLEAIAAYIESPKAGRKQNHLEIFITKNLKALKAATENSSPICKAVSRLLNNEKTKIKVPINAILELPEVAEALSEKAVMEAYIEEYIKVKEYELENTLLEKIVAYNKAGGRRDRNLAKFVRENIITLKAKPKTNRPILSAVSTCLNNRGDINPVDAILELSEIKEALSKKAMIEEQLSIKKEYELENALLHEIAAYNESTENGKYRLAAFIKENLEVLKATPKSDRPALSAVSTLLKEKEGGIKISEFSEIPEVEAALKQRATTRKNPQKKTPIVNTYAKSQNQYEKRPKNLQSKIIARKLNSGEKVKPKKARRKASSLSSV